MNAASRQHLLVCVQAAVEQTAEVIREACTGFVQFLQQVKEQNPEAAAFTKGLQEEIVNMQDLDWLKPPMLSRGSSPIG